MEDKKTLRDEISEILCEMGYEDTWFLDGFKYWDEAIIGITTDGNLIYSYDLLIKKFVDEKIDEYNADPNNCVDMCEEEWQKIIDEFEQEAIDFISYNTLRSLPYVHEGKAPIIMEDIGSFQFVLNEFKCKKNNNESC
jgi:hypothetical protein